MGGKRTLWYSYMLPRDFSDTVGGPEEINEVDVRVRDEIHAEVGNRAEADRIVVTE